MTLVLGIDSSTQSTKALVISAETGTVVAEGRAPHRNGTEVDPDVWWHACQSAIAQACAGLTERIAAVSVGGQQHGLVALDSSSLVVRPALLWNDTRSADQARRLVDQLGASWWAEQTGSVPVASFTITKLAWLAEHEPANADRVATVLLPHDWLTWHLSGRPDRFVTDRGDASGTGYFSPRTGTWLPDVLANAFGGRQPALPEILAPTTRAGQIPQPPPPQPAAQPGDSALGPASPTTQQSPISAFGETALGSTTRATQPLAGDSALDPAQRTAQPPPIDVFGQSALGPTARPNQPLPGDSALGPAQPAGEVPRGGDALSAAVGAQGAAFESAGRSLAGAVVGPGTGDNMAAALALGLRPGDVVVSLGTSGTVFAVAGSPAADPTGAVAGFCDATGAFLPLVCTLNAARVLSAVADLLGVDLDGLDSLALQAKPGAGGLVMLPYLEGERTPNLPNATGSLLGLKGGNLTPENLARAAVEGMLCGLADGLAALRAVGVQVRRVLLIGGASRSAAVQAVAAGLFGAPVEIPEPGEYVALGAARQAAWVLSGAAEPPAWDRPSRTLEPTGEGGQVLAAYAEARRSVYG